MDGPDGGMVTSEDMIKLEVVVFPEEPPLVKWTLRAGTILLLLTLVFLWAWYRWWVCAPLWHYITSSGLGLPVGMVPLMSLCSVVAPYYFFWPWSSCGHGVADEFIVWLWCSVYMKLLITLVDFWLPEFMVPLKSYSDTRFFYKNNFIRTTRLKLRTQKLRTSYEQLRLGFRCKYNCKILLKNTTHHAFTQ